MKTVSDWIESPKTALDRLLKRQAKTVLARYNGIDGQQVTGSVSSPDQPWLVFNVGLLDQAGNVVVSTRADRELVGTDKQIPPGHGFQIPIPLHWFREGAPPARVRLRVLETGHEFPKVARELPVERMLRSLTSGNITKQKAMEQLGSMEARILDSIRGNTRVVVTHEMTRTGAPLIALEIVRQLRRRHGVPVVVLSLRPGGPLLDEFLFEAHALMDGFESLLRVAPDEVIQFLSRLRQAGAESALVNSLVSTPLADACRKAGMRVISLVHEYPYLLGRDQIGLHLQSSSEVIFPCADVREAFYSEGHLESGVEESPRISVIPQGCYALDRSPIQSTEIDRMRGQLSTRFGIGQGHRLVVLCGTLDSRKGIDWLPSLLVAHAGAFPLAPPTHFVWVGRITEPSVFEHARHDLRMAGLAERFHHISELPDVRALLNLADVFMLASRIDPFPSVILESWLQGTPVIGFDRGQGCALMIRETGFGRVVPYLDATAAAGAIEDILADEVLRTKVATEGPSFVADRFPFASYADALFERLAIREEPPVDRQESPAPAAIPPVMVLGFHRTGSSFLAGWLEQAGINMSPSGYSLQAGPGNPDGHFEDLAVLTFHCLLLKSRHAPFMEQWGGDRCIFLPDYDGDWKTHLPEFREMGRKLGRSKPWGWKDPRTLLFLDLWNEVFPGALKILLLRHPLEIFVSLVRRNTDPYLFVNPLAAFDAYVAYHRSACRHLRENPDIWIVVTLPPRADDFQRLSGFLSQRLGTNLRPAGKRSQFDASRFHSYQLPADVAEDFARYFPEAHQVHRSLSESPLESHSTVSGASTPFTSAERIGWLEATTGRLTGETPDFSAALVGDPVVQRVSAS